MPEIFQFAFYFLIGHPMNLVFAIVALFLCILVFAGRYASLYPLAHLRNICSHYTLHRVFRSFATLQHCNFCRVERGMGAFDNHELTPCLTHSQLQYLAPPPDHILDSTTVEESENTESQNGISSSVSKVEAGFLNYNENSRFSDSDNHSIDSKAMESDENANNAQVAQTSNPPKKRKNKKKNKDLVFYASHSRKFSIASSSPPPLSPTLSLAERTLDSEKPTDILKVETQPRGINIPPSPRSAPPTYDSYYNPFACGLDIHLKENEMYTCENEYSTYTRTQTHLEQHSRSHHQQQQLNHHYSKQDNNYSLFNARYHQNVQREGGVARNMNDMRKFAKEKLQTNPNDRVTIEKDFSLFDRRMSALFGKSPKW